ncbi:MAG: hypothetical protein K9H26_19620 [Prolixibacteraceae bacterium]|nr:hypothetical protein [Prolixibacteraceae bacterium]
MTIQLLNLVGKELTLFKYVLIGNMPGHYSYAGSGVLEYYALGEKILQSELTLVQQHDSLRIISDAQFPGLVQNTVSDIEIMPAAYLIKKIDATLVN